MRSDSDGESKELQDAEVEVDLDTGSRVDDLHSVVSRATHTSVVTKSDAGSRMTSKTYISNLEKQLNEEKRAR